MNPLITTSDLSDILWTVVGLLYCLGVRQRAGRKFVAAENLPKTNRAQPRGDAARAALFDTAIASPRFKNRRSRSPLDVSLPRRLPGLISSDLGPV